MWFASSRSVAAADMPVEAVELAELGRRRTRRVVDAGGEAMLAVGVPLPHGAGSYVELVPLAALEHTLARLRVILVAPVLVMGAAAMVVGGFASRLALRPLAALTSAAAAAARGETDCPVWRRRTTPTCGGWPGRSTRPWTSCWQRRSFRRRLLRRDASHEAAHAAHDDAANSLQVIANRRSELPATVREALDLLTEDVERFRRLVVDLVEYPSRSDGGDRLEPRDGADRPGGGPGRPTPRRAARSPGWSLPPSRWR